MRGEACRVFSELKKLFAEKLFHAGGDAFVTCLDGVGRIVLDGTEYLLHEGESIVMPAGHPHAVSGAEMFKMLLVVVF